MADLRDVAPEPPVEQLAALVHEAWVAHQERLGWRYGPQRDDAARRSPNLVPYDALGEAEKELDRVTARRVLSGLKELGFRLELDPPQAAGSRDHLLEQANGMVARGQPLPAYDLTKKWLDAFPGDRDFLLCNARALRRCGALGRALRVLESLADGPDEDGERRGLMAAVHKELFIRAPEHAQAVHHLREAERLYREVFDRSNGTHYWHGINAATLAFLSGDEQAAAELARRVYAVCEAAPEAGDRYWLLATRAEALLVQRRFAAAAKEYRAAVAAGRERLGDIASTRRNALLLLDAHASDAADRTTIEEALRAPGVVIFAGLGADPNTLGSRFPDNAEAEIATALDDRLAALDAGLGFSGATPGAELLFIERLLARKPGIANVVLPWPRSHFVETHVRPAGERWERRFERLLGGDGAQPQVHHVVNASLGVGVDSPLYERFAEQLLFGLARLHANTLGTQVQPLVVWDRERNEVGEIADVWATQGVQLAPENIIDVRAIGQPRAGRPSSARARSERGSTLQFRTAALLFADVEDYSSIPEARLPAFIEYFVGGIGSRLGLRPYKPQNVRRVGDGLLMVFAGVREAALCALDLVEWAHGHSQPGADGQTFWSRLGLPPAMRIRVALHAGPVFECVDPLTHMPTFEGAHINYAARIEPVTPGNQVYASEAFAALAASWPEPCNEFTCEYVGRTSLAKRFGEYPLYHVRRRA